jgi:hypothetical protein
MPNLLVLDLIGRHSFGFWAVLKSRTPRCILGLENILMQDHQTSKLFQPDSRTNESRRDGCDQKRPKKFGNKVTAPIKFLKGYTRDN